MAFIPLEQAATGEQGGFTPLAETVSGSGFIPVEAVKAHEERVRSALPETLSLGGFDTGVPITPALSAYLVNLGAGITGTYRGAKQLLGLDKSGGVSAEAINEAHLAELSRDPEVGGYATAGRLIGSGFDPVAYALPLGRAKSAIDLAKQGFVAGGILGAVNPIEEGGSRVLGAAAGAVGTAVVMPAVGSVAVRLASGKWLPLLNPAETKAAAGAGAKAAPEAAGEPPAGPPPESAPAAPVEPAPPAQAAPAETPPPQQVVDEYMRVLAGAKHIGEPAAPQQAAPVGKSTPALEALNEYAKGVKGDIVQKVELVGSTAAKGVGKDTDVLYTLKPEPLPPAPAEAEAIVEGMIEKTGIDLDAKDTFVRVGERYFHVSSGAGRQVVENTGYAAEQAAKPRIELGAEPPVLYDTQLDASAAARGISAEYGAHFKAAPTAEGKWTVEQVVRSEAQLAADGRTRERALARLKPNENEDSLTTFIAKMGGLNKSEALDITGDTASVRAPNSPMLFAIRAKGGRSLDDMAEHLVESGYFPDRKDLNPIRDAIRAELDGQNHYSIYGEGKLAAERLAGDIEAEKAAVHFAEKAGIPEVERVSSPAELAAHKDFVPAAEAEMTGPRLTLAELTDRAVALNEAAVERAAIQSEGMSDAQYAKKLQEIIHANEQNVAGRDSGVVQGEQAFALAGETEAERAVREAAALARDARGRAEAATADARARADRERGDFALTGSERAADANAKQGFIPLDQAGAIDLQLASRIAGGAVGAATGAATADENASPQEIASRALLGGFAGWQIAKTGGAAIARRMAGSTEPAITAIATKTAPRDTPDVTVVGDVAEPLLTKEMSQPLIKKLTDLAKAHFAENPNSRNPNILISDDIAAKIVTGEIAPEVAAKYGISKVELATAMRSSVTDFARGMARFSHVFRELRASMTPEERAVIDAAGDPGPEPYVRPLWKKITDTWRALLVTQPATAVRNYTTQIGRIGLDAIQAPIDHWLQQLTGRPVSAHPLDGLEELLSVFQRNKKNVDQILEAFPKERDRLFQNYLSDVANTGAISTESKVWQRIGTAVNAANILNRTQEFIVRRGVFQTTLDQQLRNQGMDLQAIIKANQVGAIPEEAIAKAIDQALIKTFAETPAWGTMSRKLIDAVNAVPGASLAIPFPRFMYNAIKFQYEYSPMGVLSYLSPAERAAFAAGDTSKMSKAIIGTGLLGAAMAMRNSDHAGEKWYEYENDKGEPIDLRPFNPFASYLFVADVLKKQKDGTLYKLSASDIGQGILSTNMRAGTGLYLLDNALGMMSKSANEKKLGTKASELTGDFLAGFFTPLAVFRDAYDQFTEGQTIQRDTRGEFFGPIKRQIPGVSQTLPETELPTRAGPAVTVNPLVRQATGLTIHGPKNALERELDRLGFERREILPSTGDHELDVKYAKVMGVAAEKILVPLVESEKYDALPDTVKGVLLHGTLAEVRDEVRSAVNKTLPMSKRIEMEEKKGDPRLRYLLKEFGVFDKLRKNLGVSP